jgi:hypothetical protein
MKPCSQIKKIKLRPCSPRESSLAVIRMANSTPAVVINSSKCSARAVLITYSPGERSFIESSNSDGLPASQVWGGRTSILCPGSKIQSKGDSGLGLIQQRRGEMSMRLLNGIVVLLTLGSVPLCAQVGESRP